MTMFKKYAHLAFASILLIASVPTYTMETDEVNDITEQVETVKPAQIAWYRKTTTQYALVAIALIVAVSAGTCWYKDLSPMELAVQIKKSGASALSCTKDYLFGLGRQNKASTLAWEQFFQNAYCETVEAMAKEYNNDIAMCKAYDCYDDAAKQQLLQEYSDQFKKIWHACSHTNIISDEFKSKIWKLGHEVLINAGAEQ